MFKGLQGALGCFGKLSVFDGVSACLSQRGAVGSIASEPSGQTSEHHQS